MCGFFSDIAAGWEKQKAAAGNSPRARQAVGANTTSVTSVTASGQPVQDAGGARSTVSVPAATTTAVEVEVTGTGTGRPSTSAKVVPARIVRSLSPVVLGRQVTRSSLNRARSARDPPQARNNQAAASEFLEKLQEAFTFENLVYLLFGSLIVSGVVMFAVAINGAVWKADGPPGPPAPPSPPPPPPFPPYVFVECGANDDNSCNYAEDGDCDDGGLGSEFTLCTLGTDCEDCGGMEGRFVSRPPGAPPPPPWPPNGAPPPPHNEWPPGRVLMLIFGIITMFFVGSVVLGALGALLDDCD
jgi:hypothetical protein